MSPAETTYNDHTRTTQTVVRFLSAFLLPGFDAPQPAGDYRCRSGRRSIDGLIQACWRRVAALIHLPAIAMQVANATGGAGQIRADLDAALEKDDQ